MEYKVGDRLLCKVDDDNSTKDKYYIIIDKITFKDMSFSECVYITNNKGDRDVYFILSDWEINNYFYTEKEIRLMKLEKLNGI